MCFFIFSISAIFQASTTSVCLLSRAHHHGQLKQHNEVMQRELLAAQAWIAELEATSTASQAVLVAIRERPH